MAGIQKASKGSALADLRVEALTAAKVECRTREQFAKEIERQWRVSQQAFLRIGEYLLSARRTLPHGEYEEMIRRDLPFQPSLARKLKAIAEFVEAKKLPTEQLPVTYSAAYEIVTLTDDERERAMERGLIRPDVSMRECLSFKRELRAPHSNPPAETVIEDQDAGRRRLAELYRQRDAIAAEIADLEQRLGLG